MVNVNLKFIATALIAVSNQYAFAEHRFKIVHMNDFHARVEGISKYGSPCNSYTDGSNDQSCDGGWPRLVSAAKQIVEESDVPVIFLEDGDEFMGSVWSTYYRGAEAYTFLNNLCDKEKGAGFAACVATIGNHEWDFGYEDLANYVANLTFPVTAANVVDECNKPDNSDGRLKNLLKDYAIVDLLDKNGTNFKVGVIGYLTTETKIIASTPDCISFSDEVKTIQRVEKELAKEGVNIVIGLSHSGYDKDQYIAKELKNNELDLIIGGHSHSFLWDEDKLGKNPTLSSSKNVSTFVRGVYGKAFNGIPIFQAYYGGRFLGALDAIFSDDGALLHYVPEIRLVGSKFDGSGAPEKFQYEPDEGTLKLLLNMSVALKQFTSEVVGKNNQLLSQTRSEELGLGNAICDSMIKSMNELDLVETEGGIDICLMNSGGIRAPLAEGNVTVADVLAVLPFGNVVSVKKMSGKEIYLMFEHGFSRATRGGGEYPQVGGEGFQVIYDPAVNASCGYSDTTVQLPSCDSQFKGSITRVKSVFVKGKKISKDEEVPKYLLVTNSFVAGGGDGYKVIDDIEDERVLVNQGKTLFEVFADFIREKKEKGLTAVAENRISTKQSIGDSNDVPDDDIDNYNSGTTNSHSNKFLTICVFFVVLCL